MIKGFLNGIAGAWGKLRSRNRDDSSGASPIPQYIEKRILIDDEFIDKCLAKGDVIDLVEPLFESVRTDEGEAAYYSDISRFSVEQTYLFAIFEYDMEVNSGGHWGFYWNSSGIVWEEALRGLREIGAGEYYALMQDSVRILGGAPSRDRTKRQQQIQKANEGGFLHIVENDDIPHVLVDTSDFTLFNEIDERFFHLRGTVSLDNAELTYVKKNRKKFYFDSVVLVPNWSCELNWE